MVRSVWAARYRRSTKSEGRMGRLWCALSVFCLASHVLQGQAPRIDSIDPPQSPIAGGTVVAIKGANFQGSSLSVDKAAIVPRSEEHTSELQSLRHLVCRLLLEKK